MKLSSIIFLTAILFMTGICLAQNKTKSGKPEKPTAEKLTPDKTEKGIEKSTTGKKESAKVKLGWKIPATEKENYVLPVSAVIKNELSIRKVDEKGNVLPAQKEGDAKLRAQLYLLVNNNPANPNSARVELALSKLEVITTTRDVFLQETKGNFEKLENNVCAKDQKTGKWGPVQKSENPISDPTNKIFNMRDSFQIIDSGIMSGYQRDLTSLPIFANRGVLFVPDVLLNANFPEEEITNGDKWVVISNYSVSAVPEPATFVTKWNLVSVENNIARMTFSSFGEMKYEMKKWIVQSKTELKFSFDGELFFDIAKGIPVRAIIKYDQSKREEILNKEIVGERVKHYTLKGDVELKFEGPVKKAPEDLPARENPNTDSPLKKMGAPKG